MKATGLIVEYNPFHNGHLHHLRQSKQISGANCTVCVMSGNFIQRGEPSIVNKWARTEMALASGIDLVLELPVVYSMSSAEFFAYGAVRLLDSTGVVDSICFGSESESIQELDTLASVLADEPASYKRLLKENLARGLSYASSREKALQSYFPASSGIEAILNSSNNILGIEYLKALKRLNSNMLPFTIKRIHNEYNSIEMTGSISSATSIRKNIFSSPGDAVYSSQAEKALPSYVTSILDKEFNAGRGPICSSRYESIIISSIRSAPASALRKLPYVSEGMENRLKSAAAEAGSLNELIDRISTKRYPKTRIQRILFSILTGVTGEELENFSAYSGPQYIRVLGFNGTGRLLLSQINKKATLPVIVKAAGFKNSCNPLLRRMLQIEAHATDQYVLGYSNPEFKKAGQEFTQNIILKGHPPCLSGDIPLPLTSL
nr:nucleotidyltransferase [Anaerobacterium chartisolvens]